MPVKSRLLRAIGASCGLLLAVSAAVAAMVATPRSNLPPANLPPAKFDPHAKYDQLHRVQYHSSRLPTVSDARGQQRPVRSLLKVTWRLNHGDFVWNDDSVPEGEVWIRVDLEAQTMSVFREGHEIGTAVVLFGAHGKPTPKGTFRVIEKRQQYRSISYDAPMPFMLRLTNDGIAIHASDIQVGAATHGCIGVPEQFAAKLFQATKLATEVSLL